MRVYATPTQYGDFAEEPFDGTPAKLAKRLRAASSEVERLARFAVYAVDEDGMPTDRSVAAAFAEATCSIVEYWQETDDPLGVDAIQGAVKIGSVSLGTTSSSADSASEQEKLERRIGGRAFSILTNAGLISAAVRY